MWNYSPRPGSAYGEGVPEKMAGLQTEIDIIHNQRLNASSISIIPFGFYRAASGFDPHIVELAPGVFIPVDDINDVRLSEFRGNFTVSFQEERVALEYLDRLTATGPYQQGQESPIIGSRATATGTLALIGQSNQRYDIIIRRMLKAINEMVEMSLMFYQLNMPPGMAERIVGERGERLFNHLSREQIAGRYDNHIPSDSLSSNKALERQTKLIGYQTFAQNPIVNSDPRYLWELTADAMKSVGMSDVERFLGEKPKGADGESRPPKEEFALMNQGQVVRPSPTEDLLGHLVAHLAQRQSEKYDEMAPEHRKLLDDHIEKTKRLYRIQLILQERQATRAGLIGELGGSPSPALDEAIAAPGEGGSFGTSLPPSGSSGANAPSGGPPGLQTPSGVQGVGAPAPGVQTAGSQ